MKMSEAEMLRMLSDMAEAGSGEPQNQLRLDEDCVPVLSEAFKENEMVAVIPHPKFAPGFVHRHEFIEIAFLRRGTCLMEVEGSKFQMKPGDFCVLDTNSSHYPHAEDRDSLLINLIIKKEFFDEVFFKRLYQSNDISAFFAKSIYSKKVVNRFLVFETSGNEQVPELFDQIICEYFSAGVCSREMVECLTIMLFALMVRLHQEQTGRLFIRETDRVSKLVPNIVSYMRENLQTATRKTVAGHFGYSYSYISSLLRKATGMSFVQLRNALRMKYAENLLTSRLPITEVASLSGFSNITSFYKAFKALHGMTPQEYREALK